MTIGNVQCLFHQVCALIGARLFSPIYTPVDFCPSNNLFSLENLPSVTFKSNVESTLDDYSNASFTFWNRQRVAWIACYVVPESTHQSPWQSSCVLGPPLASKRNWLRLVSSSALFGICILALACSSLFAICGPASNDLNSGNDYKSSCLSFLSVGKLDHLLKFSVSW